MSEEIEKYEFSEVEIVQARDAMLIMAQGRLTKMAKQAISTIEELMLTADSENVRLQAALTILDRLGVTAPKQIQVTTKVSDSEMDAALDDLLSRANSARSTADPLEVQAMLDNMITDAEIVEEPDSGDPA
jgi:hypothetical protein